ncbi:MAG: protein phosphatase 2C domain-containing protein [Burkholderiales bacterium]|jgi:serine/threonine protein phosphatase PrpC|nr:protein phosphatase 2C domain-containing protein [Burkholderiales bacterium]
MATHLGSKRERNEDRIAVARIAAPNTETYTVAIVCDGVGGSESGDQAAALAIASIIVDLAQQQGRSPLKELAVSLVRQADNLVRKELQGRGATTLVMLLATASGHFVCANVGDSRAYSWNPNSNKLDQVTIDDTIENELKDLPGNGADLIKARGLQGRLSQAVGEGGRTADELRIQTYAKDRFRFGAVLGSDGLWRAARDFETAVASATTPTDAVRRAIALANWVGGVDNASLIAIADVERLCGRRQERTSAGRWQTEIALWSSSTKIKILTNNWIAEDKSTQARVKPARQKKIAKKKRYRETVNEPQLRLETVESKEARPKIEVTISNEHKKSE